MCVTVINVGYGDAILFQLKNGYSALLDGGSALESEFEGDSYRIRSADYLARQQIEHLNAVVISHIHEDHVCGLEAVLQQTVVDHLYVPYPVEPFLKGCELTPASNAPRSVPLYVAALNAYRRILLHAKEKGHSCYRVESRTGTEIWNRHEDADTGTQKLCCRCLYGDRGTGIQS